MRLGFLVGMQSGDIGGRARLRQKKIHQEIPHASGARCR
jgi:hypothetical protein